MAVNFIYAGFWRRFVALILDSIIFAIILALLISLFLFVFGHEALAGKIVINNIKIDVDLTYSLIYFIYASLFESSSWQATPGKRILSLRVVGYNGERVNFWRAFGRNVGKIVSALILMIGYMMAGWTSRKQALHDMMAGCLVIRSV